MTEKLGTNCSKLGSNGPKLGTNCSKLGWNGPILINPAKVIFVYGNPYIYFDVFFMKQKRSISTLIHTNWYQKIYTNWGLAGSPIMLSRTFSAWWNSLYG